MMTMQQKILSRIDKTARAQDLGLTLVRLGPDMGNGYIQGADDFRSVLNFTFIFRLDRGSFQFFPGTADPQGHTDSSADCILYFECGCHEAPKIDAMLLFIEKHLAETCGALADPPEPSFDHAARNINWSLLHLQKHSLVNSIPRARKGMTENTRIRREHLTGLVHLLDGLQDTAEAVGLWKHPLA